MIPIPPIKLARRAWLRVLGLLLLGLVGATALAFYGYQLHQLDSALSTYKQADAQHQVRTEAIHRLSDMEAAFNRYLLDANSANQGLLQSDKQRIEQLGQSSADVQHDQLVQSLVAGEQKWYGQTVQPIIEERRKLAAGQGLPEDFLAKYRAASQDLQIINLEIATENAYRQAQQALEQTENQLRWLWLPYLLAALLIIGVIVLGVEAMKRVNHLKQAAESASDEEEDDGKEPPHADSGH
ncbi:MAG: hypothetical protein WA738_19440 [Candidatus Angelobacter sp.]